MYETFEHKADVGVRGVSSSVEKAFSEGARALFSVEVDIWAVKASKKIKIECSAANLEELFVEWLNNLLAQASVHEMVFSKFSIKIKEQRDGKFFLDGFAYGEKLSKKHRPKLEVKAATYSQLKVFENKKEKRWIVQCIVDV
jgi:SHS2 domain-containing protein